MRVHVCVRVRARMPLRVRVRVRARARVRSRMCYNLHLIAPHLECPLRVQRATAAACRATAEACPPRLRPATAPTTAEECPLRVRHARPGSGSADPSCTRYTSHSRGPPVPGPAVPTHHVLDICWTRFLRVFLSNRSSSVYCVAADRVLKKMRCMPGVIVRSTVSRSQ